MADQARDHLTILAQLALEYQQKYQELTDAIRSTKPEAQIQQLRFQAELTTARFRSAQQILFSRLPLLVKGESDETHSASVALCRCFDELHILFQVLAECTSNSGS